MIHWLEAGLTHPSAGRKWLSRSVIALAVAVHVGMIVAAGSMMFLLPP